MFKPYRYEKRIPQETEQTLRVGGFAPPVPPLGGLFLLLAKLLPPFLIVFGVWVISAQVAFPYFSSFFSGGVRDPVSDVFWELEVYAGKGGVLAVEDPPSDSEGAADTRPVFPLFYLSIPKLGIERAEVETNSAEARPDERLGHYQGSALPGEPGNTFIYGHSVLPVFFNPKNYKTIFSTLNRLGPGDQILVEYGGKNYIYKAERLQVLKPEEVNPLFIPRSGSSYLTLMTCDPPQTPFGYC